MTSIFPQCANCRHWRVNNAQGAFCTAFPNGNGIPMEIIVNEFDHQNPHEGDHGIQFAPRPGESSPLGPNIIPPGTPRANPSRPNR